jgi:hypothetical protein
MMEVTWRSRKLSVAFTLYRNPHNICINLLTPDGERYATASANIGEQLPYDVVAIKDYTENAGIQDALIKAGVIEPRPWGWVDSGFVRVYIFPLTEAAMAAGDAPS